MAEYFKLIATIPLPGSAPVAELFTADGMPIGTWMGMPRKLKVSQLDQWAREVRPGARPWIGHESRINENGATVHIYRYIVES